MSSSFVLLNNKARGFFGIFRKRGPNLYDLANLNGHYTYTVSEYWIPIIDESLIDVLNRAPPSPVFEVLAFLQKLKKTADEEDHSGSEDCEVLERFMQEAL
jgi:hypothetical protein